MVMGGFGGWGAFYLGLYLLVIPAINLLIVPLLYWLIHRGRLEQAIWGKYLIGNGFFSFFASCIALYFSVLWGALYFLLSFGITLQAIFFVAWLVFFFRKKELPNRFYKAWGWCFALFYFLPYTIYLILVVVSFIQRN